VETPPKGKRAYLWDNTLKGFGVMVTPAGTRCYIVQYKMGGRSTPTRRYTIGHHDSPWKTEKARDRAADLLEMVRRGIDPMDADREHAEKETERRKVETELGFSTYADVFLKKHVDDRKMRSASDIHGVFRRDLKPFFKERPIHRIERDDIHELLDQIAERSESAANKAHKWLRRFFNFAVDKKSKHLKASPMHAMSAPFADGKRDRVLTDDEIRIVWMAAIGLSAPFKNLVHLLILTGQRLREVARMQWSEIDLEKREWVIPGTRTKNKQPHLVPIIDEVAILLAALAPKAKDRKGFVLTTNGEAAIAGFSKNKANLDTAIVENIRTSRIKAGLPAEDNQCQIDHWVYHDLRRTLATGCQGKKVPLVVTEAVLNHLSGERGGLKKIYQLYDYADEKRDALALWGRHVAQITKPSKHEPMPVESAA
jgi:integrase